MRLGVGLGLLFRVELVSFWWALDGIYWVGLVLLVLCFFMLMYLLVETSNGMDGIWC